MYDNTSNTLFSKLDFSGKIMADAYSKPGLTLVSTPIGNLGDISLRAIEALQSADKILCEDTRVSIKLLERHGITNKLSNYHEHNAKLVRPKIIDGLKAGARIVLISDAGTPSISDPGYQLVKACIKNNLKISTVPGPTALIAALTISGLPTDSFYFGGFLPNKKTARRKKLLEQKDLETTLIFYDSARRLLNSLKDANYCLGERPAVIARELTKIHEDVQRGNILELIEYYEHSGSPKGEVVIIIGPPTKKPNVDTKELEIVLRELLTNNSLRDSVKLATDKLGVSRSIIYEHALKINRE